MRNNREIGSKMEHLAGAFLEKRGYRILQYNFYCRRGEIDLIARESGYLVFIEVKYRQDGRMGEPGEAVGRRKQQRICRAAQYYLLSHGIEPETACRFDVVTIKGERMELIQDAFSFFAV